MAIYIGTPNEMIRRSSSDARIPYSHLRRLSTRCGAISPTAAAEYMYVTTYVHAR